MILYSEVFDQPTLARMLEHDAVVRRYRVFFSSINWSSLEPAEALSSPRGRPAHPLTAYLKAFLIKIIEGKTSMKQLCLFLLEHPLLIVELGFRLHLDPHHPYGFDPHKSLPKKRWFNHKLRTLDPRLLQDLFASSVHALQQEIPGLGEIIAVDVKHIYAWVRENNPRESIKDRFCKDRQPKGDPDCKVGVKKSTNQEQPDGSYKEKKEYLWGYGSGVVAAITADYGDVVLAEHTLPFNEADVTYYHPLYRQAVATLELFPTSITADAAYDAWHVYQTAAFHGGIAAIPLNAHGHSAVRYDTDGVPICMKGLRMHPTFQFHHPNGYRAQRFCCPLLFPQPTGQTCDHEQFLKARGCRKDPNWEPGGRMRVTLDRTSLLYKLVYRQRTSAERINSQAKDLGIERPKVRNRRSVATLNTLTYVIINVRALQRAQSINRGLLQIR